MCFSDDDLYQKNRLAFFLELFAVTVLVICFLLYVECLILCSWQFRS